MSARKSGPAGAVAVTATSDCLLCDDRKSSECTEQHTRPPNPPAPHIYHTHTLSLNHPPRKELPGRVLIKHIVRYRRKKQSFWR